MSMFSSLPWHKSSPAPRSEKVLEVFDTHWIKYAAPLCIYIISLGIALAILIAGGSSIMNSLLVQKVIFTVGLVLGTIVIHWFCHRIMSVSMEDVIITDHRFIYLDSTLWSLDEVHEISLLQVKAVDSKKSGLLQNVLRYGSISFDTGGSDMTRRVFHRIPYPDQKAALIASVLRTSAL